MPLNDFLNNAGYQAFTGSQGDIRIFLAGLVQVVLSVVGVIFFVMIFYGGYLWFTAGGNEEQVTKAKQFITRAVVGFVVTLTAYIITTWLAGLIDVATQAEGTTDVELPF